MDALCRRVVTFNRVKLSEMRRSPLRRTRVHLVDKIGRGYLIGTSDRQWWWLAVGQCHRGRDGVDKSKWFSNVMT